VAQTPTPARHFSALQGQVKPERQFKRPQLTGWIRRRIARSLAARQSVSVWFVGYLAAGLLTLLLLDGALMVTTVTPFAGDALQSGSISSAWGQVDSGHQLTLEMLAIAFAGIGVLALLFFSVFTGLSTHNAPGLGAEMPQLSPYRAGTCWLAVLWAQACIAVGLLAPAILFWIGYPLPGLLVALVAIELGQRRRDNLFAWLTNPARHLPDLFGKLGVSGSNRSLIGSTWSACFRVANILAIVVYALPLAALIAGAVAAVAGQSDLLVWQSSGFGPVQLAIAAIAVPLVLATSGAIGLLVPISIEIVERQRTRRTLVRVGRSRPWVARPGNYNAPAQDSGPAR
jgi:MFS family permease